MIDHSDGGETRELDFAAFHRRRLIDNQSNAGAFGRFRRRKLCREARSSASICLFFLVDLAFTTDKSRPPPFLT